MRRPANSSRGVTLTELLVVMLIIGLLSTVAVPVYINRMEDARIRLAMAETREIAQAEEQVAMIHGFYVPFQVLDDTAYVPGQTSTTEDSIGDEANVYAINASVPPQDQMAIQSSRYPIVRSNNGQVSSRIISMVNNWGGPFLNPQRVYLGTDPRGPGDPNYHQSTYFKLDFPLDPWGEPYRFYSPLGIIGTSAYSDSKPYNVSTSNGQLTNNDDRNFDKYAVVSWGRDNLPDYGSLAPANLAKNDIIHFFGSAGLESTFGVQ